MRLSTVDAPGETRAAVTENGVRLELRDADGVPFADVGALLRSGPGWRDAARGDVLDPLLPVRRPVLAPAATVCVGVNYGAHIEEMGRELPGAPTLFAKLPQALADPSAEVVVPAASTKVDYEGELVVVIGTGGRRIPLERALEHVAGVTLMNDVSMRDFQYRSIQWFAGKSWNGSTPVGPEVVTLDELGGLETLRGLELTTAVNGEVRQRGVIGDLVFGIPELVSDLSTIIELSPGDLIATGTPGGVGHAMEPPTYLRPGDVVEVSLPGIETLRTVFAAPREP